MVICRFIKAESLTIYYSLDDFNATSMKKDINVVKEFRHSMMLWGIRFHITFRLSYESCIALAVSFLAIMRLRKMKMKMKQTIILNSIWMKEKNRKQKGKEHRKTQKTLKNGGRSV